MRVLGFVVAMLIGGVGCDDCERFVGRCCMICTGGKPCGDSCIAITATCTKSTGCACSREQADVESDVDAAISSPAPTP